MGDGGRRAERSGGSGDGTSGRAGETSGAIERRGGRGRAGYMAPMDVGAMFGATSYGAEVAATPVPPQHSAPHSGKHLIAISHGADPRDLQKRKLFL